MHSTATNHSFIAADYALPLNHFLQRIIPKANDCKCIYMQNFTDIAQLVVSSTFPILLNVFL